MRGETIDNLVRGGREALARADWESARDHFEQARAVQETPEVLDGLSAAAHFRGEHREAIELKERAFAAYRLGGKRTEAAEVARWLAFLHGAVHGNRAAANGWMRLAERELEGSGDSVEHGRLALDRAPWTDDPHSQGSITERYMHAAQVLFPGAAARSEARMFGAPTDSEASSDPGQ